MISKDGTCRNPLINITLKQISSLTGSYSFMTLSINKNCWCSGKKLNILDTISNYYENRIFSIIFWDPTSNKSENSGINFESVTLASEPKQCWEAFGGIWEAPGRHLEASGEAWATMGDQGG